MIEVAGRFSLRLSVTVVLLCVVSAVSGVLVGASFFARTTSTLQTTTAFNNINGTRTATVIGTVENAYLLTNGSLVVTYRAGGYDVLAFGTGFLCAPSHDEQAWGPVATNQSVVLRTNLGENLTEGTSCGFFVTPNSNNAPIVDMKVYPKVAAAIPSPGGLNLTSASLEIVLNRVCTTVGLLNNNTFCYNPIHVTVALKNSGASPITSIIIETIGVGTIPNQSFLYGGVPVSPSNPVPPKAVALLDEEGLTGSSFVFCATFQSGSAASIYVVFQ
ncbi:MAG: hypothetical protein OK438_01565 [Thaumarchaeota archaeon]|nr:hypothetical protein [Nitrososphaerota archaeon]